MVVLINTTHRSLGAHVEDVDDKVGKLALLVDSDPGLGDAPITTIMWDGITVVLQQN